MAQDRPRNDVAFADGNVPGNNGARVTLGQHSAAKRFRRGMRHWWPYYVMMAPGLIFFFIWHYVPIWEAKMAFEQVRIIPPNIWVG